MGEEHYRWEPAIVENMSTGEIEAKMKALLPSFSLSEFTAKTERYLSCEDLAEEEYYPYATFPDTDEDFIWMACCELWKRLVPDRMAMEHLADRFDDKIEEMAQAEEKKKWRKLVQLGEDAFELIRPHIIELTPDGYRLKEESYEKFREAAIYDVDAFLEDLLFDLASTGDHVKVLEIAEMLATAFGDDMFIDHKAQSLFALGRIEEGEQCFQDILTRNPDTVWFAIHAGDCILEYGENDYPKARSYYLKAVDIAKATSHLPGAEDELRVVYERLINLANEQGKPDDAAYYKGLLDAVQVSPPTQVMAPGVKVGRNDPCPCGSGKKYKKCCGQSEARKVEPPPFDRRLMERSLLGVKQLVSDQKLDSVGEINQYLSGVMKNGKALQWIPKTPLEKAQSLIFEALETSGKERLKLVNQALKASPDCADAYALLAEEKAQSLEEALALYDAGVKAGERALGEKIFQEEVGHFWKMVETRSYMRARAGLARCLWELGKHKEAIEHYRDILRLNPGDNQGIRYVLAACLLELGEISALQALLEQYDEPTADWLYTEALVAFIQQGDSPDARQHLLQALEHNRHVVLYLLGQKRLPRQLPDRVGFGDESEAIVYTAEFGSGWLKAKDAISWLRFVCRNEQTIRQGQSKPLDVPEAFIQAFESRDKTPQPAKENLVQIYTFKVNLEESPGVWRKIEIKGSQTLHNLHKVIFKAYERYDEHLYAFFLSNKPWDSSSEYGLPDPESSARNAKRARIESLGLSVKKRFLYLFDFGDEWWHSIELLGIKEQEPEDKYPRIVESKGEAPPEYADDDE